MATAASSGTSPAPAGRPSRLQTYLELVRFSHTIFALPFAVMAALIAIRWGGDPALDWTSPVGAIRGTLGILLCMVTARTAAMAFNRLVDRTIDAANPRTAARHLPRGDVSVGEVLLLVVVSSAAFIASTLLFLPNWLPLVLSVPVLAWLLGYSYAKRFTALAHLWLGAALGFALLDLVSANPEILAVPLRVRPPRWVKSIRLRPPSSSTRFRPLRSSRSRTPAPRARSPARSPP